MSVCHNTDIFLWLPTGKSEKISAKNAEKAIGTNCDRRLKTNINLKSILICQLT